MSCVLIGELEWSGGRSDDSHIDLYMTWLVETDTRYDGPIKAMHCPGLPEVGSSWNFGHPLDDSLRDKYSFATCRPEIKVSPVTTPLPNFYWRVMQTFSTRSLEIAYLGDYSTPFSEEPRIRGGFTNRTEEQWRDRFGRLIRNTAWERFTGKAVEFKLAIENITISGTPTARRPTDTYSGNINAVNDREIWGFPKRCVQLANVTWEKQFYKVSSAFYRPVFEFEIDVRMDSQGNKYSGHDRRLVDIANKVLSEGGDKNKPADFQAYRMIPDREKSKVVLDANGQPWVPPSETAEVPYRIAEYYQEIDMIGTLGVPGAL